LSIDVQECLYCGKCEQVCPENNIIYHKIKKDD
jgi:formate hydrogenlyase subunit 6/NADH:ubiquinone oxidoreductase subunit I